MMRMIFVDGLFIFADVLFCVTSPLQLKWKNKKDDDNGGYSQEFLFSLLKKVSDLLGWNKMLLSFE